jgi:O-antigen biosynthesis protein
VPYTAATREPDIPPSFSVVVCTRDRPVELERCLSALLKQDAPAGQIVVVDSHPLSCPAEALARQFGADYVHEPVAGVSRARNTGAAHAHADLVAMIDDDAVPEPGWLAALAAQFEDPDVGAVAGRIVDFPAATAEEKLCAALGGHDCGPHRRVLDSTSPQWFERACFGGVGNGANLALRRSVFETWPGFCESLGAGTRVAGGEESYAFFQLIDAGWRVVYAPEARVSHPFPSSLKALRARHLRSNSAAAGYLLFLFAEQPRYRVALLRYVAEACVGKRRSWRGTGDRIEVRIAPVWRGAVAFARGAVDFFLMKAFGPVVPPRAADERVQQVLRASNS